MKLDWQIDQITRMAMSIWVQLKQKTNSNFLRITKRDGGTVYSGISSVSGSGCYFEEESIYTADRTETYLQECNEEEESIGRSPELRV